MIRQRCAIYTRKSTEEGLEQDFNSLDAQREACAAYILSQKHEGWIQLSEGYNDGGYSGGSMDRPGLQQLLDHVRNGRIDIIVVYKVDRLTRSLSDFARMVDTFDWAGVSFVSVTQAFYTTSSMGRLTLNVMLSFAQFEREVTAERIRDKVAASKQKGMWMGGSVPVNFEVPFKRRQNGRAKPIVIAPHSSANPDPELIALVADAQRWSKELMDGSVSSIKQITDREGLRSGAVSRILPLAWLAPDISTAILEGRQPAHLNAKTLRNLPELPLNWEKQRELLGFLQT